MQNFVKLLRPIDLSIIDLSLFTIWLTVCYLNSLDRSSPTPVSV